jgi:hypothetical protein
MKSTSLIDALHSTMVRFDPHVQQVRQSWSHPLAHLTHFARSRFRKRFFQHVFVKIVFQMGQNKKITLSKWTTEIAQPVSPTRSIMAYGPLASPVPNQNKRLQLDPHLPHPPPSSPLSCPASLARLGLEIRRRRPARSDFVGKIDRNHSLLRLHGFSLSASSAGSVLCESQPRSRRLAAITRLPYQLIHPSELSALVFANRNMGAVHLMLYRPDVTLWSHAN